MEYYALIIFPSTGNYCILPEYHKCVLPPLTFMVGPTMNLISRTHHSCERREYAFMVLREYLIIFPSTVEKSTHMDTIKATPTPCTKLIYPYELKINPKKGW